ncbi:MAG: RHS repeat-associated core domain-containing protein [Fimbriimonadaceae bacterium]
MHSGLKNAGAQTDAPASGDPSASATREYDAFGSPTAASGSWQGPFGYAGQFDYQTEASGLHLLGHRYYDASLGRFLARDPIGDGNNWYAYCENDPVAFYDCQGEFPERITGYTLHGLHSAIAHDGVGVKPGAMLDTIRNGRVTERPHPKGTTYRFEGPRGVVVLNQDGKVVTTWPKGRENWRHQPPLKARVPGSRGNGIPRPGAGRGGSGGAVGVFGTLVMGLDAFQEGFRHVFFRRLRIAAHIRAIDEDNGEADKWEGVGE